MKILIVTRPDEVVFRMGFEGSEEKIDAAILKIKQDMPDCTFEEETE